MLVGYMRVSMAEQNFARQRNALLAATNTIGNAVGALAVAVWEGQQFPILRRIMPRRQQR